ncbi:hypothetical protein HME9302_02189 [Alteripontixanthobacter maritimus]|uniref:Uncharacterized protein n=1 Tax=Alteripontixanthobacter maritimus TaxID=2161824 RepID=A0A369Q917_9SPHN|nr:hypothetical protein [Alteripontixanthobacter maritimus]RDC60972.1 hypothetical protein HME9302_02189 [Alteripontixanthobacter maritimus]
MTDRKKTEPLSQEERQANLAPETHNDEQDDHREQAQEVAQQARKNAGKSASPTESTKPKGGINPEDDSTKDVIDHMRDMESSGRIDMDAYRGEPNHDDNVDKFGKAAKPDGLRGDGT